MLTIRHITRITSVAMAVVFSGAIVAAQAGDAPSARADKMGSTAACEQARQFAWFKGQLELTDGDTNPFVKIETPAECRSVQASNATVKTQVSTESRSEPGTSMSAASDDLRAVSAR